MECVRRLCLMGGAEEIVDGLDGVEGVNGYFDKDSVPVGHCTVPQAWQLKGTEISAAERFFGDEAGIGICIACEVEGFAVHILDIAYKIDRVEMGGGLHHFHIILVVGINLGGFENLRRYRSIVVVCHIRSATGFTDVAYHAADAHGPVELTYEIIGEFGLG